MRRSTAAVIMALLVLARTPAAAAVAGDQSYQFQIVKAQGTLYNPWTRSDDRVELRSFRGSGAKDGDFVAPTIRIAPGNSLTVDLDNRLEPCTPQQIEKHACFNQTNLHTHGLWVSPSGNSDNVLLSIEPGQTFRYQYKISADHPAGTFWYHPHRHGSGFVQVGSGMAGALIVTGHRKPTLTSPGDVDILLKDGTGRPFAERVMIFQQIQYGCFDEKGVIEGRMEKDEYIQPWTCTVGKVGRIESPDHDWDWPQSGRFTGINGKVQPPLTRARVGQFERWRLIHGGTREPIKMQLRALDTAAPDLRQVRGADQEKWIARYCTGTPLPMWQIAMDGLTRSNVRRTDVAVLFPGDRIDVLTRFPTAGRYCVIQDAARLAAKPQPLRALAVTESEGQAPTGGDATAELRANLIRTATRALSGTTNGPVRDKVLAELRDGMRLTSFVWHPPVRDEELTGFREATVNILETSKGPFFHINGRPYDHDRIDHTLPLGQAEEWYATSLLGHHPLHLHVNPFQVVQVHNAKGEDMIDPASPGFDSDYAGLANEWKDTIMLKEGVRVVFRTRYERFTGDFVTHCHIMFHGDHGMMQNLRIVDPKKQQTPAATHH